MLVIRIRESFYLTEYNCDLHTLQLGIGDTFKGVKNVLGKCKQIAKFAKQSPQSMEQLQKECLEKNIPFRKLKNS